MSLGALRGLMLKAPVQIVIAAALVVSVVAISGRPSVNPDTFSYFKRGAAVADVLVKPASRLLHMSSAGAPAGALTTASPPGAAANDHHDQTPMGARSPFYGAALYMTWLIGGLWLMTWINALLVAWMIYALAERLRLKQAFYLPIMAVLTAATALPFYVGFATPDIFAPLGVLATIVIAVFWSGLGWLERAALWALVAVSLCFHTSHVLLELTLLAAIAPLLWWARVSAGSISARVGVLLLSIVAAATTESAYDAFIRIQTGSPPHRPPFLAARMLEDGPGRAYLRQACTHGAAYVLCQFRNLPLNDAQTILWSGAAAGGIVMDSSPAVKTALSKQEAGFAMGTFAHYPMWETGVSLQNWWKQLMLFKVAEPLADPVALDASIKPPVDEIEALVPGGRACVDRPGTCASRFDAGPLFAVHLSAVLISLAALSVYAVRTKAWRFAGARPGAGLEEDGAVELLIICILIFSIVSNAAITGVISGPFPRYGARMAALAPLAALLGFASYFSKGGSVARRSAPGAETAA